MKHKRLDIVKEVAWNLVIYVLYYIYCIVILLIFHLLAYRFLELEWTLRTIAGYAFIAATVMMAARIIGLVKKGDSKEE